MDHGHDQGAKCPMIMTFHAGHCETILWSGWVASTVTEFVLSAIALFVLALLYEVIKYFRERLRKMSMRQEAERMAHRGTKTSTAGSESTGPTCSNAPLAELREKSYMERILSVSHLIQTVINLIQIVISYLLMLVFMTFNYWLCLAVILGLGVGYFLFGWIRQDSYANECCS